MVRKFIFRDLNTSHEDDENYGDLESAYPVSTELHLNSGRYEQRIDLSKDKNYEASSDHDGSGSNKFEQGFEAYTNKSSLDYDLEVENAKKEYYDFGYRDCKNHMEKIISDYKINFDIVSILNEKLSEITKNPEIENEILSLYSNIFKLILSKLYISLPTNWEKLLIGDIMQIIKKNYKNGSIEIVVHCDKVDYCNNILEIQNLPSKTKDVISIVGDESLNVNDCYVKYSDTVLKYDSKSVENEINSILSKL